MANSDECNIHAYKLENKYVWSIQFHPEINNETGVQILRETASIFGWENVEELISEAYDSNIGSRILHNFINEI